MILSKIRENRVELSSSLLVFHLGWLNHLNAKGIIGNEKMVVFKTQATIDPVKAISECIDYILLVTDSNHSETLKKAMHDFMNSTEPGKDNLRALWIEQFATGIHFVVPDPGPLYQKTPFSEKEYDLFFGTEMFNNSQKYNMHVSTISDFLIHKLITNEEADACKKEKTPRARLFKIFSNISTKGFPKQKVWKEIQECLENCTI